MMPIIAIIGGQWGDEGKGKVVDFAASSADVVCRFCGGPNAGHTVVNPRGEFKMHLIPSGIFYPEVKCIIGSGVALDLNILFSEIEEFRARGMDMGRLLISSRCHIIMPYHILLDELEERERGGEALGTTKRGIGPCYVDRVARRGLKMSDLTDKQRLKTRLEFILKQENAILEKLYGAPPLDFSPLYQTYCHYGERLSPLVKDTEEVMEESLREGKKVILEGAQGTLLDIDFGTYPYVTSTSTTAGGACIGAGVSPQKLDRVVGVFKSYTTRVGNGPMPTELKDETGKIIRERASEFGTTTGRPRRCGWLDTVAARYSIRINGMDAIALTRLDILDSFPSLKVGIGYEIKGKQLDHFPPSTALLSECTPLYEELPGWQTSTTQARSFHDLPSRAQGFVEALERILACPVGLISVGSHRDQTILRDGYSFWP
jgi:adenylosuccinate synthase